MSHIESLPPEKRLTSMSITDFLSAEFPPQEIMLEPWLATQSLSMIYAMRGIGKTHVSLGVACAVASGGDFLTWKAPEARHVLLIDGEMTKHSLQKRLKEITDSSDKEMEPEALSIIAADDQKYGIPDLATQYGQMAIEEQITSETKLIILDNLSTLIHSGNENDAESWQSVQQWAIRQRSKGRSIIFIHHSGKSGQQRGTSRREDALNTVIVLKHASDYSPDQGASFEIHFEKNRDAHGDDVAPFKAQLTNDDNGKQCWNTQPLSESNYERAIQLFKNGMKQAEIAKALNIGPPAVSKYLKRARETGRVEAE